MSVKKPKKDLEAVFCTAGEVKGLQIWRIEDLFIVPVPKKEYGTFFTGDSYIILFTDIFRSGEKRWDLHFWLGSKSSQDERGAAAVITTQLDDYLGGGPVQHRELEGNESSKFLHYFKAGIRYKEGGIDGGFNLVEQNRRLIQRCLHVKGKARRVRCFEVKFTWESFNSGDCFLIEVDNTIYRWKGEQANPFEILRATELAASIRDNETGGRASIKEVNEGGYLPKELIQALGEPPKRFPPATDDTVPVHATLFHVSSDTGELIVEKIGETPKLRKTMLLTGDCFILDAANEGNIFVWKGKEASADERHGAMEHAEDFIVKNNYCPEQTKITVFPQNSETVIFKDFFQNWK